MPKKFINKSLNAFFEAQEYEYEDMRKLMFDTARGTQQVSKEEAEEEIRKMMFQVIELDPADVKNPKLLRRALKNNHNKIFEVIEDVVDDMLVQGWSESPFFQEFVDTRNVGAGDRNDFVSDKDVILTVANVSGNHHDIMLQRLGEGEHYQVNISRYGAAVGTDLKLYFTGRIDWTKLVNAIYTAFDKKVKDTIYTEVMNVGDKLPVSDMFNKSVSLADDTNKEVVDQLIEDVAAANGTDQVVIMGTSTATKKLGNLTDINWVSSRMKDEKYETGRLGFYEGTALISIPQRMIRKGSTLERMIDGTHLLVFPVGMDKFIKFVNQGDPEILEVTEQGARVDDTMKFEYQQSFGAAVVVGKYFGHIKITG